MANRLEVGSATTTNFSSKVDDFSVANKTLDKTDAGNTEFYWYFTNATKNYGYYLTIPEIFSAVNALATWAVGRGWTSEDKKMQAQLEHVNGLGNDNFDKVVWNHEVMKVVVGDAFTEVKKGKTGIIVNMIPIDPENVRIVYGKNGLIKRYDVWNSNKWIPIQKDNMWHSTNKRIGNQVHGQSQVEPAKFIIDARNEALADERIIKHRDKALGIAYYETSNAGKISFANAAIEKAVNKGEMLGLPKDTVKIEPYPSRSSEDRTAWIAYLENFFYQVFGVPRSIATSDGTSEVGGKMGHVIFEPIYVKEQNDLEGDLLRQHAIKILFNRPPSLGGLQQETEAKNTGQTNIQPNDVEASLTRE
jgi:hypothetical protein|tara:strand:+ start:2380 stop:3462 length:1083 start_codon:yes stop_codon:yes gene_type:complete